jgi:UDP-N-acetylmuramoyl-tripeptide--D-alanyl-D-alanine ligase
MKSFRIKILYSLSRCILKKYHPDVIGIVGSMGKTAAKEAIYSVLSNKFNIRKNKGKYDNDIEIPLTIIGSPIQNYSFFGWWGIMFQAVKLVINKDKNYPDILILEVNTTKQGELAYLAKQINFRFGIVTAVESSSVDAFGGIKKFAAEQEVLVSQLSSDGIAILNVDDKIVAAMKSEATKITFGVNQDAEIKASDPTISLNGSVPGEMPIKGISFKLNYQGNVVPILIPGILGAHQIYSALIAVICGLVYQMHLGEIADSLKKYNAPAGRMRLIKGIKNTVLIDDSYSSSPASSKAALLAMSLIPLKEGAENYAVLSDMADLGKMSEDLHREVGHYVAEKGINKLITVGEKARDIALAAREAGMKEDKVFSFSDAKSAARFIQDRLEKNDIVLIKGSSSMGMERVVKELMADPARAKQLLVQR